MQKRPIMAIGYKGTNMKNNAPGDQEPKPPEGSDFAGDDYGIRNDQILDLCDFIVRKLWEQVYIDGSKNAGEKPQVNDLGLKDLKDIATTLDTVWNLTQGILDIDAKIKFALDVEEEMLEEMENLQDQLDSEEDSEEKNDDDEDTDDETDNTPGEN